MLQLGSVQFSMDTRAYEDLDRVVKYRWPVLERLGRRPARQWLGVGEETIKLKGAIYPGFDPAGRTVGGGQVEELRSLGEQGVPQDLVTGTGRSLGKWVILEVGEMQTVFMGNGAPRKQEFTIELAFYGTAGFGLEGVLFAGGVFFVPRLSVSAGIGGFSLSANLGG